jgi:uncharacterized protein (TIGR03083 family)
MAEVTAMTRAEGEALVAYLREVPADRWDEMTVCAPWTVGHLVAHLTALGNQTMPNLARRFVRSGFNFEKTVESDLQKYLEGTPAERLDRLEAAVKNPTTPKPLSEIALGEFLSHSEDIRRALGDRGEHNQDHIAVVGPLQAKSKAPLNGKKRAQGLSFRATDGDWTFGEGPEVRGAGIDLISAITGRGYGLEHLEGEGLATLSGRL